MNNGNLLETKTVNSNELIGNGKKYHVPLYQRDYSWNQDNWEDLWADILLVIENASVHYMGAIVLQRKDNKSFAIIDGQQRITTITILALACINRISELAVSGIETAQNEERVKLLSTKFIGDKDPASLTYFSKLRLNENNDSFFQTYVLTFRTPPTLRHLKDSDKLLLKAYDFYVEKVKMHFGANPDGAQIAKFLNEIVAEKLMFIQITVEDELRAYTVFETLNSRGVGLTVTDLLKNYLFSLAGKVDLPHVRRQWERIVDTIGLDKFPVFLYHYWLSKYPLVRQEYLYKNIRASVRDSVTLFDLLDDLERNVTVYTALNNAADELWRGNNHLKKRIKELNLFKVKQCFPLLLIAYDKLPDIFAQVAKIVTVISFRSTVIGGFHSGRLREIYNKAAVKVARGEITTPREIALHIQRLYLSDTDFRNDFSTASFKIRRNRKLIRYILFEIENQISNSSYDFIENAATIEHILPESAPVDWETDFPQNVMDNYIHRLGNYTLLESTDNRDAGTLPYLAKRAIFKNSNFQMSQKIDYPDWNPNNLDARQMRMARLATAIWRLPYYDD